MSDNVVALPMRPRLLDKPPEVKRPQPRDSELMDHARDLDPLLTRAELFRQACKLRDWDNDTAWEWWKQIQHEVFRR